MASAKLSPEDKPSDKLLNKIAEFVDADCVGAVASNLDMKDSKCSQIMADSPNNTRNQVFKVMDYSHTKRISIGICTHSSEKRKKNKKRKEVAFAFAWCG